MNSLINDCITLSLILDQIGNINWKNFNSVDLSYIEVIFPLGHLVSKQYSDKLKHARQVSILHTVIIPWRPFNASHRYSIVR